MRSFPVTIGSQTIEQGVIYTLSLPGDGSIKAEGHDALVRLFRETNLDYELPWDWKWYWEVSEKNPYGTGAFPKRVARWYKKEFNIDLYKLEHTLPNGKTVPLAEAIGNAVRPHVNDTELVYQFDFVNRFDWKPSTFGEKTDSCFWGSRKEARAILRDQNALAIRFWSTDRTQGLARAWLVPDCPRQGEAIVFNGYGLAGDPTLKIAAILSQWAERSHKRLRLTNNGGGSGSIYINGSHGYLVATSERLPYHDSYDFSWDTQRVHCEGCDKIVKASSIHNGPDQRLYCETCKEARFVHCRHCRHVFSAADLIIMPGGERVCQNCRASHYHECAFCGMLRGSDEMLVLSQNRRICRTCFEGNATKCPSCFVGVLNNELAESGYCAECEQRRLDYEQRREDRQRLQAELEQARAQLADREQRRARARQQQRDDNGRFVRLPSVNDAEVTLDAVVRDGQNFTVNVQQNPWTIEFEEAPDGHWQQVPQQWTAVQPGIVAGDQYVQLAGEVVDAAAQDVQAAQPDGTTARALNALRDLMNAQPDEEGNDAE